MREHFIAIFQYFAPLMLLVLAIFYLALSDKASLFHTFGAKNKKFSTISSKNVSTQNGTISKIENNFVNNTIDKMENSNLRAFQKLDKI